jgi:hypothetical protein
MTAAPRLARAPRGMEQPGALITDCSEVELRNEGHRADRLGKYSLLISCEAAERIARGSRNSSDD